MFSTCHVIELLAWNSNSRVDLDSKLTPDFCDVIKLLDWDFDSKVDLDRDSDSRLDSK